MSWAQRIHRSAKLLQTALFSGEGLNLAIASHSAANLRKRSDVFIFIENPARFGDDVRSGDVPEK
jgi:hypothetical protein